ncbi:MAG TPA: hypothetical protein VIH92_06575 [Solirubrobacteraceae bacterium]
MAPISPHAAAAAAAKKRGAPILALSVEQACEALGVSWDTWRTHIEPDMRLVRLGRRKLIPVSELQAWLDRHAEGVGVGKWDADVLQGAPAPLARPGAWQRRLSSHAIGTVHRRIIWR